MQCVVSCTILLQPNIVYINTIKIGYKNIGYHGAISVFIDVMVVPSSFSKQLGSMMPPLHKTHKTVTRNVCIGYCMTACGFSLSQIRQHCLLKYPPECPISLVGSVPDYQHEGPEFDSHYTTTSTQSKLLSSYIIII